jgi:tetratricopeptide (TPR) repeat protein
MGSPRLFWAVSMTIIPMVAPLAVVAQSAGGMRSSELGRSEKLTTTPGKPALRRPPRRGRSRSGPSRENRSATNDWNPHYLEGKDEFVHGHYDKALTELMRNVADCDAIDFDAMSRENGYFEHIQQSVPGMGQSAHAFIRASNLQWVGAALAAQGRYDLAEARFTEMEAYAQQCFPERLSTFEGCSCQGLAFLLAAQGRYNSAADRYRLALAHIEGNVAQIGLPPAPCVAMILTALASVELARGQGAAAEQCIRRADRVQEAQHQLGIGPAPLDRAAVLTVFAHVRANQDRQSEAYDLYVQGLDLIHEVRDDHPLAAFCLDGLGEIDLARGRLDQSEEHFRESLTVRQAGVGESHRDVAYSLDGLARVAAARGNPDEAESHIRAALAILARALGPSHPDAIELAAHLKRRNAPPQPGERPAPFHARFLAIPTFLTVGWQVLHVGKDWRVTETNIRRREVREAKTARRAAMADQARAAAPTGR